MCQYVDISMNMSVCIYQYECVSFITSVNLKSIEKSKHQELNHLTHPNIIDDVSYRGILLDLSSNS